MATILALVPLLLIVGGVHYIERDPALQEFKKRYGQRSKLSSSEEAASAAAGPKLQTPAESRAAELERRIAALEALLPRGAAAQAGGHGPTAAPAPPA